MEWGKKNWPTIFDPLEKAIDSSYAKVQKVSFDNAYYRKDIGKKAKEAK